MSIAVNKLVEICQYEMKVDFGMGGIPLTEFLVGIGLIVVVMIGYFWWKSHKE